MVRVVEGTHKAPSQMLTFQLCFLLDPFLMKQNCDWVSQPRWAGWRWGPGTTLPEWEASKGITRLFLSSRNFYKEETTGYGPNRLALYGTALDHTTCEDEQAPCRAEARGLRAGTAPSTRQPLRRPSHLHWGGATSLLCFTKRHLVQLTATERMRRSKSVWPPQG